MIIGCILHRPSGAGGTGGQARIKVKLSAAFCFTKNTSNTIYFHNSSWLEYGGAPEKAAKARLCRQLMHIKQAGKYTKLVKISFQDIADNLVLVSNSFSTKPLMKTKLKGDNKQVYSGGYDRFLQPRGFILKARPRRIECVQVLKNKQIMGSAGLPA